MAVSSTSALHWTSPSDINVKNQTVIFLHAAWMSSSMFDETVSQLGRELPNTNLVCLDLNGHGKTVGGRVQFTYWDQADDVAKLMDDLRLDKAVVVGVSMGASVALCLALAHQSRVSGLVLIGSTASSATEQQKEGFDQLGKAWTSTPTPSEAIMNLAIQTWGGDPDVNGERARAIKAYWVARHSGAENINAILESNQEREDVVSRLGEIRVPVLMVHGELDATYSLEGAEAIRDKLANTDVKFEVIKGSGHLVIGMRDSEDVSQLVGDFVTERCSAQ